MLPHYCIVYCLAMQWRWFEWKKKNYSTDLFLEHLVLLKQICRVNCQFVFSCVCVFTSVIYLSYSSWLWWPNCFVQYSRHVLWHLHRIMPFPHCVYHVCGIQWRCYYDIEWVCVRVCVCVWERDSERVSEWVNCTYSHTYTVVNQWFVYHVMAQHNWTISPLC